MTEPSSDDGYDDEGPEPDCIVCGEQGGNGVPCDPCGRVGPVRAPRVPTDDMDPFG